MTDPYLWLEDREAPEVERWVDQQNAYSRQVLDGLKVRAQLLTELERLIAVKSESRPVQYGPYEFTTRHDGKQAFAQIWVREADGKERVLLDPNTWTADGSMAMGWTHVSPDGSKVAFTTHENGDEREVLRVVDTATGDLLSEELPDVGSHRQTMVWKPDASGFYYSGPGGIREHLLGSDPDADRTLLPDRGMGVDDSMSLEGRYLAVTTWDDWLHNSVHLIDLDKGEAQLSSAGAQHQALLQNGKLLVRSDATEPNHSLWVADPAQPNRLELLIPGEPDTPEAQGATMKDFTMVGDQLFVLFMKDASSQLKQFTMEGELVREIPLPNLGTVSRISAVGSRELEYDFSSFHIPGSTYRYRPDTGETRLVRKHEVPGYDPERYETRQEWCTSKDGTRVPMFLVRKKGTTGPAPTVLYGYGGFDISLTPEFSPEVIPFLERGGVYAVANLRGGGEFGSDWHQAGMLEKKQQVFDDYIAAAEHLVGTGHTRPDLLAGRGGSNGGLLIGAAITQRPDLFKAAISEVPLMDMLRFDQMDHKGYVSEYGSSQDPDQAKFLIAYSPYHHVSEGVKYPATLLTTGTNDARVGPGHARKMAARLQEVSEAPVLLQEDRSGGHGPGRAFGDYLAAEADKWGFLCWQLGLEPPAEQRSAEVRPGSAPGTLVQLAA
ncbi:MAG: S9 family peptidase [Armatimonadetes bacterium]|nr:S9 family peptidase [Armatimonadota bacterium]